MGPVVSFGDSIYSQRTKVLNHREFYTLYMWQLLSKESFRTQEQH